MRRSPRAAPPGEQARHRAAGRGRHPDPRAGVSAPGPAPRAARDFVKDLEARPPAHPASRVPRDMVG